MLPSHCGYVAILGRPNVGKSTLLNRIIGQKISITSRKPQTTRHQILGIHTVENCQAIFVDTPGLKDKIPDQLGHYMAKASFSMINSVDVIVFVVDSLTWSDQDNFVLGKLAGCKCPVLLAVNKIDTVTDKDRLLPHLEKLSQRYDFAEIVPISAKNGNQVDTLLQKISLLLPEGEFFYPADQVTNRDERFMAAELIREKLTRLLGQELPYELTVEIETFTLKKKKLHIDALIWVARDGQKRIVIGKDGTNLKKVGREARLDMEKQFGRQVVLHTWVKIKKGWSDNEQLLKKLGY